jgi:hypothetical protein
MEHGVAEADEDPRAEEAKVIAVGEDEWREKASGAKRCDGRASGEILLPFSGRKKPL